MMEKYRNFLRERKKKQKQCKRSTRKNWCKARYSKQECFAALCRATLWTSRNLPHISFPPKSHDSLLRTSWDYPAVFKHFMWFLKEPHVHKHASTCHSDKISHFAFASKRDLKNNNVKIWGPVVIQGATRVDRMRTQILLNTKCWWNTVGNSSCVFQYSM